MLSRLGYTFRETWASLRRNVTLTVAAILTSAVSLFLFGVTLLVQRGFDNLLSKWAGGVADDRLRQLRGDARPGRARSSRSSRPTRTVVDVDKLRRTSTTRRRWPRPSGCSPATRARSRCSTRTTCPPSSRSCRLPGKTDVLVRPRRGRSVVCPRSNEVVLARDQVEQISKLRNFVQTVTVGLSVLLLIGALILIWNTIRTAMFARRREIEVMKLVGATNWFIRIPVHARGPDPGPRRCTARRVASCCSSTDCGPNGVVQAAGRERLHRARGQRQLPPIW